MKKLLLILLLLPLFANAQVILQAGDSNYVRIDGASYQRGYLGSRYLVSGRDTLTGINVNSTFPRTLYSPAKYSVYLDGDNGNAPFTSAAAVRVWMTANLEATSSGGGGSSTNIYNSDGTLTADRTVDGDDNSVFFLNNKEWAAGIYSGVTGIDISGGKGSDIIEITDNNSEVFYADGSAMSTTIGYGSTTAIFDDINQTITFSDYDLYLGGTQINGEYIYTESETNGNFVAIRGGQAVVQIGNDNGQIYFGVSASGTTLHIGYPVYTDNTAAVAGGLVTGDHFTDLTGIDHTVK